MLDGAIVEKAILDTRILATKKGQALAYPYQV
jgi:hypothetical protein